MLDQDKARVLDTLGRLVSWPTVSDASVEPCAAFLAQRAEDVGMTVTRYDVSEGKVNVVARGGPATPEGGLLLSGHMDVVPTLGQRWDTDPFRLTERDDILLGRGTCDMKGFIAAVDTALRDIDVATLKNELVLVWTCDEEVGCRGSMDLVRQLQTEGTTLPKAAVIGEPTDFRIVHVHPGHCSWTIRVSGHSAHSSRPSLGASAIEGAAEIILALRQLRDAWAAQPSFEGDLPTRWPTLNIGQIQGGTAINIVPNSCEFTVGVRQLPGQSSDDIEGELQDCLDRVGKHLSRRRISVELHRTQVAPSLHTDADCSHVHLLQPWASSPKPGGAPFATDGGALAQLGVEPLVFGPGSIDQAHRPNEHIRTSDLVRTVSIVRDLVRTRCMTTTASSTTRYNL